MPTYVYECAKCGDEIEEWQSFSDEPLKKHTGCGGKLAKVLQPVGIVFKGSGFHRTDSRRAAKRSRPDGSSDSGDSSPSSEKPEKSEKSDSSASSRSDDRGSKSSDSKSSDSKSAGSKSSDTAKSATNSK